MLRMRAVIALCAALAVAAPMAHADDPFYAGKRLTILINFAAGGPTDIEGRLFAKHLARHVDGTPNIVIQNMDGAGGIVGAKYLGEVASRDGTMVGYFTGTAFMYALDPERFRVDFKTYQFVATQPGTTVHFVRADVAPGMTEPTDIIKAKGLILGGLSVDTPKDLRLRLAMDMLGIPFKYVTGYRSSPAARLAFQRGEINFFSESPPSYRGVVDPSMVKTGRRSRCSTMPATTAKISSIRTASRVCRSRCSTSSTTRSKARCRPGSSGRSTRPSSPPTGSS